jgi:hypothetical protein
LVLLVELHEQFHVVTLVVMLVWLTQEQLVWQVVTLTGTVIIVGAGGFGVMVVLTATYEVTQQL